MLKKITLLLLTFCLLSCNYQGKRQIMGEAAGIADSIDMSVLSEQELEALNRANQIFSEVEAFMLAHREELDEDNPQTGKPFYEEIDGEQYLSTRYLELSKQAANWWYGPLYDHWIQNLMVGSVSHSLRRIDFFEQGDSAVAYLTLKGNCEIYNKEKQKIEEVQQEVPMAVKLVRERDGWFIDDFRSQGYSETEQFQDIIVFTPYRGEWRPVSGDSLDGYFLSDHEICSNLRASKFFSYDLQGDTLRLQEVFYDENYALKEKDEPLRYAVLSKSQDTLHIWQDNGPAQPFVKAH